MQMHRTSSLVSILLSASIIFSTQSFAAPSPTPTPTPTPTLSVIDEYLNALDKFEMEIEVYFDAMKLREEMRDMMNETFASAVLKSTRDAKIATRRATSAANKSAIIEQRKLAIQNAVLQRSAAIAALGPMPVKPIEPIRPKGVMELAPLSKKEKKEKKENRKSTTSPLDYDE